MWSCKGCQSVIHKHYQCPAVNISRMEVPQWPTPPGLETAKILFNEISMMTSQIIKWENFPVPGALLLAMSFLMITNENSVHAHMVFPWRERSDADEKVIFVPKHHQHLEHPTNMAVIFPASAMWILSIKCMFLECFYATAVPNQPPQLKPLLKEVWVSETQSPPWFYNALCCKSFRTLSQQVV